MNGKFKFCFLLLQLLAHAYTLSLNRYNDRHIPVKRPAMLQMRMGTHQGLKKQGDCFYNICEHVANYPEEMVKNIVEKHTALHSFFGSVIEPANDTVKIFSRIHGEITEPFCKTVDITAAPKLMRDINDVERAIANVKDYTQIIKFQACDFSNGEKCFAGNILDYKTKCEQKYNVIKLVTANVETHALEYQKFQIPSTCVCTYTKMFDD